LNRREGFHEQQKLKDSFFEEIEKVSSLKELDPRKINEFAESLGRIIHKDIATSQLRKVYGEIKKLQRKALFDEKLLDPFAPRLAYASARHRELETVYDVFKKCRPKIKGSEDLEKFIFILEALVAYHKYYEVKHQR
jgi:CRISPR type III-A-associated protein Csm2